MAVPAHDERDFEFAKKYKLPIRVVIDRPGKPLDSKRMNEAYVDDGVMTASGPFDGQPNRKAIERIADTPPPRSPSGSSLRGPQSGA